MQDERLNIKKIIIPEDIKERDLGDEIVVVKSGKDELHSFKETGLEIWRMLRTGSDIESIISEMSTKYETDRETISADLIDFLVDCKQKKLVDY